MTVSILGTGWLGGALFKTLVSNTTFTVYGSSRKAAIRAALQSYCQEQHQLFAIDAPNFSERDAAFFSADTLIVTIPPGRRQENGVEQYPATINAIIRQAEANGIKHLIYTSSTGVYGNSLGIVNEDTPTAPATNSAKAVVAAEKCFLASTIPSSILRLAGLYGPDRHPGRWFANKTAIPNSDAPVNLIHRADVVAAILRVIENPPTTAKNQLFNVCAASHPSRADFYSNAVLALGRQVPEMQAGGATNKQIDSNKLRKTLHWQPTYDNLPLLG